MFRVISEMLSENAIDVFRGANLGGDIWFEYDDIGALSESLGVPAADTLGEVVLFAEFRVRLVVRRSCLVASLALMILTVSSRSVWAITTRRPV